MEVTILSGATMGGSAIAVATSDGWLLIDYGMAPSDDAMPPALAALGDRPIVACILTHAHTDHCGALPALARMAPHAGLYASSPTIGLLPVMLEDTLRRMTATQQRSGRPLPWTHADMEHALRRIRPLPVGERPLPTAPRTLVRVTPSGHIAGSVAVGVRTATGTLVVSSDIGPPQQRTVARPALPPLTGVDLLIMEATYGNRGLPPRTHEEERLVADVATVLARGGHALIPAFALGRAQEVLCILHDAMQRAALPPAPIYLDGLASRVTAVYARQRDALHPALAIHCAPATPTTDPLRAARRVRGAAQRQAILGGPPAIIIAGSGMLHGGAARGYAEAILDDARHGIFLVGYVAPTSPGAALVHAAATGAPVVLWEGPPRPVACRVAQYTLSAHAGVDALVAYARAVAPRHIALVHGDDDARHALQRCLEDVGFATTLPADGDRLTLPARAGEEPAPAPAGPGRPRAGKEPTPRAGEEPAPHGMHVWAMA